MAFFRGLNPKQRSQAMAGSFLAVVLVFVTPLASSHSYFAGVVAGAALLVTGSAAAAILGNRYAAQLSGAGWRCPDCPEKIGLSDEAEAFRISGVIGDVPDEYVALIVCGNQHRTTVRWDLAWQEMASELEDAARTAERRASATAKDHPKESRSHREFARRAHALLRENDPGDYRYMNGPELQDVLSHYRRRPWPRSERDRLYKLLAAATAFMQLQNADAS